MDVVVVVVVVGNISGIVAVVVFDRKAAVECCGRSWVKRRSVEVVEGWRR